MMTALDHPLVQDYLRRLREESHRLPVDEAYDLETQIREHLSDALGESPTEAEIRETLDRLGQPSVVVGAGTTSAQADPQSPRPGRTTQPGDERTTQPDGAWREAGALVGLVGGALLFWLPVVNLVLWAGGMVLLFLSRRWSVADKVWGALALGLAPWLFILAGALAWTTTAEVCESDAAGVVTCTGGGDGGLTALNIVVWAVTITYLVLYVYTLVRLIRRAARPGGTV